MRPLVSTIPTKEEVVAPKRQRLNKYDFAMLFLKQNGRCGCGCGKLLERGSIHEEHGKPNALRDASVENGLPDALWRSDCHKEKTRGDNQQIKKANRQARKTGRQRIGKVSKKIPQPSKPQRQAEYQRKKKWAADQKAART